MKDQGYIEVSGLSISQLIDICAGLNLISFGHTYDRKALVDLVQRNLPVVPSPDYYPQLEQVEPLLRVDEAEGGGLSFTVSGEGLEHISGLVKRIHEGLS